MANITPQPGIMDIELYKGGKSHIPGRHDVLKLSSNENPWGPSPAAIDAAKATLDELHLYPSTDHASLRKAIGDAHGLDPDRLICGAGSDEVIGFLCQVFAGPGDEVLTHAHAFSMYRIYAQAHGATPVIAPETDRTVDVDALLAAVTQNTKLVFITNPGNPTGTLLRTDELTRLADGLPSHVVLVLDGAYAEFAEGFDGGSSLASQRPNVVMTRTFSKLYGLGGLRIGWGYAARNIIDMLNRVRGPFNLSGTQLAAAEAAVKDIGFADHCVRETIRLRGKLIAGLASHKIATDPSHANFVMARFKSEAQAVAADAHLQSNGIITRRVTGYGFPEALRITVPTAPDLDRLLSAFATLHEAAA
ncbi:MAG: histidinol-phosphate transaminase [Pseudomonadota bacterium]